MHAYVCTCVQICAHANTCEHMRTMRAILCTCEHILGRCVFMGAHVSTYDTCVPMCTFVHMVCARVHMCAHVVHTCKAHECACSHMCPHVCRYHIWFTCVSERVHKCARLYIWMHMRGHVCTCMFMCACVCICVQMVAHVRAGVETMCTCVHKCANVCTCDQMRAHVWKYVLMRVTVGRCAQYVHRCANVSR